MVDWAKLQNSGPTLFTYIQYRSASILYLAEMQMQGYDWLYYYFTGD